MSNELQVRELLTEQPAAATTETKSLDQVMEALVRDSRHDSQSFLDETVAKYGGE